MTLLDYLRAKLFTPLHITEVDWELSPEGYNTGGWGLHIQTESLAKFGQLLLDGGKWHGRQLLPADWVKSMMTEQQPGTGYGFQMWQCEYPGAWRADGALGQYILVIPDKDMVVVITECTLIDGARQRRLVWDKLLPALSDAPLTAILHACNESSRPTPCRCPKANHRPPWPAHSKGNASVWRPTNMAGRRLNGNRPPIARRCN